MPETREHIRALADLFLTGAPAAEGTHPQAPRTRPCVELILVGHLPVRAGLWLTQYADDVARDKGPTALLRFDTEQVILEILRGTESSARAAATATLEEGIAVCGSDVAHWIIRPGIDERIGALLESSPDVLTILTGADDAAVVAAYRTIKDLRDAAERTSLRLPAIELAILGAEADAARRAAVSLSDTSELHLGIRPMLRRCVHAMGSLGSTLHFRFPSDNVLPLSTLVSHLRAAGSMEAGMASMTEHQRLDDNPMRADSFDRHRIEMLATPISEAGFSASRIGAGEADRGDQDRPVLDSTECPAAPVRLSPKIEVQVEPKQVARRPVPRMAPPARALASWIKGLALLPVRCPDAPDIEIAVDSSGGCHLIAWEDRLRALSMVGAWLRKHRDLIAMACHDHAIDSTRAVQSHVVTSEPRQIADLHGTDLRLHLLAPVEVEGKSGWFCAALNG